MFQSFMQLYWAESSMQPAGFESRSGPSLIDAVIIFFYKGINIMNGSAAAWWRCGAADIQVGSDAEAGVQTEPGAKTERPWLHPMKIRAQRGQ